MRRTALREEDSKMCIYISNHIHMHIIELVYVFWNIYIYIHNT